VAGLPACSVGRRRSEYATVSSARIVGSMKLVADAELVEHLQALLFEK
jgi:hypothetical protein